MVKLWPSPSVTPVNPASDELFPKYKIPDETVFPIVENILKQTRLSVRTC
jgi:hypothetical protein